MIAPFLRVSRDDRRCAGRALPTKSAAANDRCWTSMPGGHATTEGVAVCACSCAVIVRAELTRQAINTSDIAALVSQRRAEPSGRANRAGALQAMAMNIPVLVRNRRARVEGRSSAGKLTSYRPGCIEQGMNVEVVSRGVAENGRGSV